MSAEIKELVSYLDVKFAAIDQRFERVDQRFDGVDKRFDGADKKFDGVNKRLDDIDKKLTSHDEQLSAIRIELTNVYDVLETKADRSTLSEMLSSLDHYSKKADFYFQEHIMLSQKVDRHEKWHEETAKKLGIKFR